MTMFESLMPFLAALKRNAAPVDHPIDNDAEVGQRSLEEEGDSCSEPLPEPESV